MRLEWSIFAQADREAIFDYIEADSPQAAATVDDRIASQVETLARFPQSGRPAASREPANW
jgi:toxin ParE1/3/4